MHSPPRSVRKDIIKNKNNHKRRTEISFSPVGSGLFTLFSASSNFSLVWSLAQPGALTLFVLSAWLASTSFAVSVDHRVSWDPKFLLLGGACEVYLSLHPPQTDLVLAPVVMLVIWGFSFLPQTSSWPLMRIYRAVAVRDTIYWKTMPLLSFSMNAWFFQPVILVYYSLCCIYCQFWEIKLF